MSTIQFAELKRKIVRALDDAEIAEASKVAGAQYTASQLADAVEAALGSIVHRCWKNDVYSLATTNSVFSLPANFIAVQGVRALSTNRFVERLDLAVDVADQKGLRWTLYPSGYITFTSEILAGEYSLYYSALWNTPSAETDVVECPSLVITALIYFAAAHCLMMKASSASSIRTFNTKVDSGTPEDNSLQKQAFSYRKLAEMELDKYPMQESGRF